MKDFVLECCVDSVESAIIAQNAGANRLEICSSLITGGLTPTAAMFNEIAKNVTIKKHVLIRPRFGDFCYTDYEYKVIKAEIEQFRDLGADGIVIGGVLPNGEVDAENMKPLLAAAGNMKKMFHRAIDVCKDQLESLELVIKLGFDGVLTSGGEADCLKGKPMIEKMYKLANGRADILIGAGVTAGVIAKMCDNIRFSDFHMSGKAVLQSEMQYRRENVPMGLDNLSEFEIYRTDYNKIIKAKEILESI